MSTELAKHATRGLMEWLGKYKGQIEAVLPKHMTPMRVMRLITGEIDRTPALRQCTIRSVINAVVTASSLGLEIRPGSAYLIPYGKQATLLIDYRGKIDLATRSGKIEDIEAHIVFAKDRFNFIRGAKETVLTHVPAFFSTDDSGNMLPVEDRGAPVLGYAVAHIRGASNPHIEVMSWKQIMAIKERSRAKASGPWVTDEIEMARKTLVHRICKMIPQSPELAKSQQVDDQAESGQPLDDAIEITMPPEDEDQPLMVESAEEQQRVAEEKLKAAGITPTAEAPKRGRKPQPVTEIKPRPEGSAGTVEHTVITIPWSNDEERQQAFFALRAELKERGRLDYYTRVMEDCGAGPSADPWAMTEDNARKAFRLLKASLDLAEELKENA